jgi:hypothetical protein
VETQSPVCKGLEMLLAPVATAAIISALCVIDLSGGGV